MIEGKGKGGAPVRLGRDGKPWRGRKRRGSEDIKRDKLVEDVLRENRCKSLQVMFCAGRETMLILLFLAVEIYDLCRRWSRPLSMMIKRRITASAEAFRKEFMDAVSARQRKKKAAPAQAPGRGVGGKKEEGRFWRRDQSWEGQAGVARAAMVRTLLKMRRSKVK